VAHGQEGRQTTVTRCPSSTLVRWFFVTGHASSNIFIVLRFEAIERKQQKYKLLFIHQVVMYQQEPEGASFLKQTIHIHV